jgi:ABC-type antimicrobial peptide transport system ATPase subunit
MKKKVEKVKGGEGFGQRGGRSKLLPYGGWREIRQKRECQQIAVMRGGQFLELGPARVILERPQVEYTKEVLAAVPEIPHTGPV